MPPCSKPVTADHVLVIEEALVEHSLLEHEGPLDGDVAGPEVKIAQPIHVADAVVRKSGTATWDPSEALGT